MWASPGADVGESRRGCGRVPARMWVSPGADVGESRRGCGPTVIRLVAALGLLVVPARMVGTRAWWPCRPLPPQRTHCQRRRRAAPKFAFLLRLERVRALREPARRAPTRKRESTAAVPCVSACALVTVRRRSVQMGGAAVMTQCAVSMPQCPLSPWYPLVLLSTP